MYHPLTQDHPRLRGEKSLHITFSFAPIGSPPLTRGKAHKIADVQDPQRITPAYAGKRYVFGTGLYVL